MKDSKTAQTQVLASGANKRVMTICRGPPLDNERLKKTYITVSGAESGTHVGKKHGLDWQDVQN